MISLQFVYNNSNIIGLSAKDVKDEDEDVLIITSVGGVDKWTSMSLPYKPNPDRKSYTRFNRFDWVTLSIDGTVDKLMVFPLELNPIRALVMQYLTL